MLQFVKEIMSHALASKEFYLGASSADKRTFRIMDTGHETFSLAEWPHIVLTMRTRWIPCVEDEAISINLYGDCAVLQICAFVALSGQYLVRKQCTHPWWLQNGLTMSSVKAFCTAGD